uniref:Uncharacterized protein n=1 Tax=Phytophthora fragariae TaxID=53985 RepID=A0A6A3DQF8_9STRA|nr:hypothetical protein PF009_g26024 [Phytophthora fragariae]
MSLLNALKKSDMKPGSRSWRIASLAPKRLNTASSYASATVCAARDAFALTTTNPVKRSTQTNSSVLPL